MRSVRLDDELDARVRRAAAARRETVSEFLRKAAATRADAVLAERPSPPKKNSEILAEIIAEVGPLEHQGWGTSSRRTGQVFTELLDEQDRRKRRRRT